MRLFCKLRVNGITNQTAGPLDIPCSSALPFTRKSDGTDEPVTVQTMFSTEVVRSSDSDGRLAVYVFPVGEHHAYRGAPLHLHHEQDEWIHVLGGEFVAEVGGERMHDKVTVWRILECRQS